MENDTNPGDSRDQMADSDKLTSLGSSSSLPHRPLQALLELRGAGVHLSDGEDPDEYVRPLREGWD